VVNGNPTIKLYNPDFDGGHLGLISNICQLWVEGLII
jgi:hypothetical protein